mmetsp:Transcript_4689/g.5088  ORF Transcript_4689/g.5088 Transcript_4689/m.5088 type:complete len:197 (-) Transcript_4689:72-662(-)
MSLHFIILSILVASSYGQSGNLLVSWPLTTPFPAELFYMLEASFEASGITAEESLLTRDEDLDNTEDLTDSCVESTLFETTSDIDLDAKFRFRFTSAEYAGPATASVIVSNTPQAASYRLFIGDPMDPDFENVVTSTANPTTTLSISFNIVQNQRVTIDIQPFGVGFSPATICFESDFEVFEVLGSPCPRRLSSGV